ncbi:hypothetical protein BGZ54_006200, partial [Gamsiella multidivaricata]
VVLAQPSHQLDDQSAEAGLDAVPLVDPTPGLHNVPNIAPNKSVNNISRVSTLPPDYVQATTTTSAAPVYSKGSRSITFSAIRVPGIVTGHVQVGGNSSEGDASAAGAEGVRPPANSPLGAETIQPYSEIIPPNNDSPSTIEIATPSAENDELAVNIGQSNPDNTSQITLDISDYDHHSVNIINPRAHQSFRNYKQLFKSFSQAIALDHIRQTEQTKRAMTQLFDSLADERARNMPLHLAMKDMEEVIQQMEQQALDRLAIIQKRVRTTLARTLDFQEYSGPRLFIVLPKILRPRDHSLSLTASQFRLYFLCECGPHTMSENTRRPHEIHFANHEGYDLERPEEFFKRYKTYVLTMAQMIKYGATVEGVVVPAVERFELADETVPGQGHFKFMKENLGSLVDATISFVQKQQCGTSDGKDDRAEQTDTDEQHEPKGADLRELEWYLKFYSTNYISGNLHRIITPEEHVKCVCADHYRESNFSTVTKELRDFLRSNGGVLYEEMGKVILSLATAMLAQQFYLIISKGCWIQDLSISLDWIVGIEDLRAFATAVNQARILHLTLRGTPLQTETIEGSDMAVMAGAVKHHWFDPIVQAMSDEGIQEKKSEALDWGAMLHVSDPATMTLILDWREDHADGFFDDMISALQHLKTARIYRQQYFMNATFSEGRINLIEAVVPSLDSILDDDWRLLEEGYLSKLTIYREPMAERWNRLFLILQRNPRLSYLRIGELSDNFFRLAQLIALIKKTIGLREGSSALRKVKFYPRDTGIPSSITIIGPTASIRISTQDQRNIPNTGTSKDPHNYDNWYIKRLKMTWGTTDDLALRLDKLTNSQVSRITTLELRPRDLSAIGLDSIDRVIEKSKSLRKFSLILTSLEDEIQLKKAERLLTRYSTMLTSLSLEGGEIHRWRLRLQPICSSRRDLPRMETFCIEGWGTDTVEYVQWIAALVSNPFEPSVSYTPFAESSAQEGFIHEFVNTPDEARLAYRPLKEIRLTGFDLESENWSLLLRALDFAELERLVLRCSNFMLEQLELLIECISLDEGSTFPLTLLSVENSAKAKDKLMSASKELQDRLRHKAPFISIVEETEDPE